MWFQLRRIASGSAPVAAATRSRRRGDLRLADPDDVDAAEDDPAPVLLEHDRGGLEPEAAVAGRVAHLAHEADQRQVERRIEGEPRGAGEQLAHREVRDPDEPARVDRLPCRLHHGDSAYTEVEGSAVDGLTAEADVDEKLRAPITGVLGVGLCGRRIGLEGEPLRLLLVLLEQQLRLHAVEVEHEHAVLAGDAEVAGVRPAPGLVSLAAERSDHPAREPDRDLDVEVDPVVEQRPRGRARPRARSGRARARGRAGATAARRGSRRRHPPGPTSPSPPPPRNPPTSTTA